MGEETILDTLLWAAILVSVVLGFLSTAALGRQYADLEYQREINLNGIRKIQSWVNMRIHSNRIALAVSYTITSIISIVDYNIVGRMWISRVLFLTILLAFTASALLDWLAERRQVKIIVNDPGMSKIGDIRNQIHSFRQSMQELYGVVELIKKTQAEDEVVQRVLQDLTARIDKLHSDIRSLDPQYRPQ